MLELRSCPKGYDQDQDKAVTPETTVARIKSILASTGQGVLAESRRVDTGRLGIPVFLSVCGPKARSIMPTRKQMGKGASVAQAEASALMELVERFSFFSFWADESHFARVCWTEAQRHWPDALMPIEAVMASVNEDISPADATRVMDLVPWRFVEALNLATGRMERVPLDWFKLLNEFNGSSAGNTPEESILQGACELVERHVCAILDRKRPALPTITLKSCQADPVLADLLSRFRHNGIKVILKDFSLGLPVPTVAALAHYPATFPALSEIVFTAGTAASPVKAAIRALTEVAQLAGDFETGKVYEASGLSKFTAPDQYAWLEAGPRVALDSLPDIEDQDILNELNRLAQGLLAQGRTLYTVDLTTPLLDTPANYNFVPGFQFRERTMRGGLGLFVGRTLAENMAPEDALRGLAVLEEVNPGAYYLPFFRGLVALRQEDLVLARTLFAQAEPLQPGREEQGLAAFYQAYALSLAGEWGECPAILDRAIDRDPEVKEFFNLRGVAKFRAKDYAAAALDFEAVLALDSGSAPDMANLGLCHKFQGNQEEAIHCLRAALDMDPGLDFARTHLSEYGEFEEFK